MTLEDLKIFVAACEAGSLSALARQLGKTQSAVSQHISRLEKELGVPLLERSGRGITPTEAGGVFRDLALEGLDSIEVGLKRVKEMRDGEVGTLTITTGGTTVRHFLRRTIVGFREEHPTVNLRFLPASSTRQCFDILRLEQADLAFVTMGESVRGIDELTVIRQGLFLLTAKDDPLADRKSLKISDLQEIRYLGLSAGTSHRDAIQQAASEHGVVLTPEIVFDDFDTASIFVDLGMGHAIVPAVQAHNFVESGNITAVPIKDLPPVEVGWAYRHVAYLAAPARDFMKEFENDLTIMKDLPGVTVLNAP